MGPAIELSGWDAVIPFIVEDEPPPIPITPWTVGERCPSGWVHVECNTDEPVSFKTLGAAFGLHSKRNFEVARLWAASLEMADALEDLLHYDGGANSALDDEYVLARARAALAKARGQA